MARYVTPESACVSLYDAVSRASQDGLTALEAAVDGGQHVTVDTLKRELAVMESPLKPAPAKETPSSETVIGPLCPVSCTAVCLIC
jgi:hypothetical protein